MIITHIPFNGNLIGLTALLMNLQPQMDDDDLIYVSDPTRQAIAVCKHYTSSRCVVMIEPVDENQARARAIDLCMGHEMDGILTLTPEVVVSTTLIQNIKRASHMSEHTHLVCRMMASETLDPNFVWFNKSTQKSDVIDTLEVDSNAYFIKRSAISRDTTKFITPKWGLLTNESIWRFYATKKQQAGKTTR